MYYKRLRVKLLIIVALYPVIALYSMRAFEREIFPFFWWELFSYIPAQQRQDYGLRIIQYGDRKPDPPPYFEHASPLINNPTSIEAQTSIQLLGAAIEQSESGEAEKLRRLIETVHMQDPQSVTYQVIRREFDLIERWQCQCFAEEEVIAEFTHHDESAPD